MILFDETNVTVGGDLSGQSELTDLITTVSNNSTSNVNHQVGEAHIVLGSTLAVVAFPADSLVWHLAP